MAGKVYALLVGINAYPAPVRPLSGCVNDVERMRTLLKTRIPDEEQVPPVTLLNEQATRQAVIDAFRSHLGQAGPDDVALFYYSGHGSQEHTPPELWHLEPDRLDETLVCYDSRLDGHWDLADKELSRLIAEVAVKQPHIVVILDSCHSGSGTRAADDDGVRRVPTDPRVRPIDTFIVSPDEAAQSATSRSAAGAAVDWVDLPGGKHVLLAACRAEQEAKEQFLGGQRRGVFSYFLTETLERTGESLTYRDIWKRVSALVRGHAAQQVPQLEVSDVAQMDERFLGGAIPARSPYFTVSHDKDLGWVIDAGSVHGIPAVSGDDTTVLAIFPTSVNLNQIRDLTSSLGRARVTRTLPNQSAVSISLSDGGALDPAETYRALVVSSPVRPLRVSFEGDAARAALARQALETSGPGGQHSLYLREAARDEADLRLVASETGYQILRVADDRALTVSVTGAGGGDAGRAIENLEQVARWLSIQTLANPTSRIPADAVQVEIIPDSGDSAASAEIDANAQDGTARAREWRFEYRYRDGAWRRPSFRLKLKNTWSERVYCVLLTFTESYAIKSNVLLKPAVRWLEPGQETPAYENMPIPATIPDALYQQGITHLRDWVKLIVCTDEWDPSLLEQGALTVQRGPRSVMRGGLAGLRTLDRLSSRLQWRDLGDTPENDEQYVDWAVADLVVETVRPLGSTPVPRPGVPASLGAGVTLEGHPSLEARARLTTAGDAARGLGTLALPALLRDDPTAASPFELSTGRSGEAGLSVVELVDIQDHTVVTSEQPLVLRIAAPLANGEHILPVGYDGEFFLPLGVAHRTGDGIRLEIDRLPPPESTKSLTGSVRIFLQKIVSKVTGQTFRYPLLTATDLVDDEVQYVDDLAEVRRRVAAAERIVLVVHGIIGDTRGMAARMHRMAAASADRSSPWDLVLAFDYENINTVIEDTARDLQARLAAVGLGPGHGKSLDVVAHSMGGLVVRWLVEREGGAPLVRRLVLLGTPNEGSPWPTVQALATVLIGLGLNALNVVAWPARVLGGLLKVVETVDVSLDEMEPNSVFLRNLAASADPNVPYILIAGNTSIIGLEPGSDNPALRARFDRLMTRLMHGTMGLAFFGQPNDIAVSLSSIGGVPTTRSPKPEIIEVACDHISYFDSEDCANILVTVFDDA